MKTDTQPTTENKMSKAILMIGGPGAGKSYIRKRDYADLKVLDCDSFKESHPDYDPKDPAALHEWSKKQLKRAFFRTIGTGEDFVLDGTGTNVERYVTWINQLRDADYEVEVVYVWTPLNVALDRNANRERNVPEHIVREKHATVAVAYEILSGYADAVRVVNNG